MVQKRVICYMSLLAFSLSLTTSILCVRKVDSYKWRSIIREDTKSVQLKWQAVEQKAQNTVVQVWSQATEFNWLEPYKAPEQYQGAGTAFFINEEGYLLTNFHVIEGAKSVFIFVPTLGQKLLDVTIVGVCPEADIALLKLTQESKTLVESALGKVPYLPLGDSDMLYPTEPVLALGYPLGQRYIKRTIGAFAGREYLQRYGIESMRKPGKSYLHITAPINPGNSGGPSLNKQGEVIGINSAGIRTAQNIGYIIPINDVKNMLQGLHTKTLLRKPNIGLQYNRATDEHVRYLKNPVPGGVYIHHVQDNSLAARAGIAVGDMWYSIECQGTRYDIDQYGDVAVQWRSSDKVTIDELLTRLPVGTPITLTIYRNGQKKEYTLPFDIPTLCPIRKIYPDYEPEEIDYELCGGMCVMQLRQNHFKMLPKTSLLRLYARLDHRTKEALVITHILRGSPVHKLSCFYPGTLIDMVNGKQVKNLAEFRAALLESAQTGTILITTKDHISSVLSLEKVLKEESRLARDFMFSISPIIKQLWQLSQDKQ